jgi:O-antigen/teichoic acid export membrane protein
MDGGPTFLVAVIVVAFAVLFSLTALALAACGQLHYPYRAALVALLANIVGVALLVLAGAATA